MAVVYDFLDYKEPKRKIKKFLALGWVCALFSLLAFCWYKFVLLFGLCALLIGIFSNLKCNKSGITLIVGSILVMITALVGSFLINAFIKTIVGVFFLIG